LGLRYVGLVEIFHRAWKDSFSISLPQVSMLAMGPSTQRLARVWFMAFTKFIIYVTKIQRRPNFEIAVCGSIIAINWLHP